jgi:DNA-directed RNA polymerase specialized sigma24 family protein
MAPRRPLPSSLSTEPSKTERDRPLREDEFEGVWAYFAPDVARHVRGRLATTSLVRPEAAARGASGEGARLLGKVGAVRQALACDSALQEDLCQEVALHLWRWTREGRMRASLPFIRCWLRDAVRWIVRAELRQHAILVFASGPDDIDGDDGPVAAWAEPASRFDTAAIAEGRLFLETAERRLGERKVAVLSARLAGETDAMIGASLDKKASNVRVVVHRTTKALRALLESEESAAA